MPERIALAKAWLNEELGRDDYGFAPASSDASFRRYFRITYDGNSVIIMDAPPEKENAEHFVNVARALFEHGLNVPEIFATDYQQGFVLLSDLGTRTYLNELNASSAQQLYGDALKALLTLQSEVPTEHELFPDYDRELLMNEMQLFADWYLGKHLQLSLSAEQQQRLQQAFTQLADMALSQTQVVVHRDYHSRNLMITDQHNPGIIDFQDAVVGPVTYDLVSLLRDCYIAWPQQEILNWVEGYHQRALEAGVISDVSLETFTRWFDWMGIQRHLKASGIFARLNHRDGKDGYLKDIPRTLGYILQVSENDKELADLHALLTELGVHHIAD